MNEKKLYHTIGQVSEFTDLPQSVLRYWETVFPRFNPKKSPGGNRLYTDEDMNIIQKIKELLYVQKFTIQGANAQLESTLMCAEDQENEKDKLKIDENISLSLNTQVLKEIVIKLKKIIESLSE